jgi:hypothetical protein
VFVVVLTAASGSIVTPRAVGPFDDWDQAQDMQQRLIQQWEAEQSSDIPTATVVRVEDPLPGVVVGEL